METTPSRKADLSATLWSLIFAVCLLLASAHVALSAVEQDQEESGLIEATFTRAR